MTKFSDLALDPRVLQAVLEAGYETPTPIQAQAIPEALKGRDVLGIAQTGTGKTASFVLPMVTLLGQGRARARMPRSLVLAPTRELAAQVAENFDTYAKHTKLTKALLIGGVSFGEQDKLIDRGVDVLIATPGRLLDHFERGKLLLTGVQIMVVDEADRMLDMGFIPDIERIFQLTPFTRQTMFYSATMAPEIERITNTFLTNPAKIEVARQATASLTITQALIQVTPARKDRTFAEKRSVPRALIRAEGEACTNAIIFCNRKMDVDVVAKSLKAHGFNAAPIHGDLEQSMRMKTLDAFRDGSLHLLVASDVAARGLDIPAVSHVFNFDVPSHPEDYVHRIGRTGRAGRLGKAYTIAVPSDEKYLKAIESLVKIEIPHGSLPEGYVPDQGDGAPDRAREDRSAGRDGGGRERGGRNGRDRERERPRKPHDEVAAMAPVVVVQRPVVVAEAATEDRREARPERSESRGDGRSDGRNDGRRDNRSEGRGEGRSEPRGEARTEHRNDSRPDRRDDRREERREPREERRDYRRDRDLGPSVVGMGDHVPDFILRSFAIKAAPVDAAEEPSTGTEG
ncbi:MAG: DEAD/DEAH box helicase [Rhodobacterales bacterium 32-66-7]|nr:MAG: DEAD/DEAH box helicase [Rhodobacterales bacterium 32-66-7]